MEKKILLVSHGTLAQGLLSSAKLILGEEQTKHIEYINCYVDPKKNMQEEINKFIDDNMDKELVIITDIFGGSVNNYLMNFLNRDNLLLISGACLPLLLDVSLFNGNNSELKTHIENTKDSMIVVNSVIKAEEDDF